MLSLLLDENLSPEIVRQITEKRSDIQIASIYHWQNGQYRGAPDTAILMAALQERLTLVTYDQKTILPLLVQWGASGIDHAGVVFIDDRTIPSNNFGALVRALAALWDADHKEDWINRVDFLRQA